MIIQLGNSQINMNAIAFVSYLPNMIDTDMIELHFIGGEVLELDTPETVKAYKDAIAALRFGVGVQVPK